jgi:drug/metabolite transporter (DMT)-like permease
MNNGVLLGLFAYASFAFGDATIKSLGSSISVFQIGFFSIVFSSILIFFTKPKGEHWRDFWKMSMPLAVHGRATCGLLAGILSVYAFTHVPLAEVYSLIFLAPMIVTILSSFFLRERVGLWRWFSVLVGLCGVLLVVRPGFKTFELGHFAALAVAVVAALTSVLLRSMAGREKRTSIMGTLIIYGLVGNAVLGGASFEIPTTGQLAMLAVIGTCTAVGQLAFLAACRLSPASQIAPTHYSQIGWAVLLGAIFFQELPDLYTYLGLALIVGAGLLTMFREKLKFGTIRWIPFFRSRT